MLVELGFHKTAGWLNQYINKIPMRRLSEEAEVSYPLVTEAASRFTRRQLANKIENAQRGLDKMESFYRNSQNPFVNPTQRRINPFKHEEAVLRVKNALIPSLKEAINQRELWIRQALRHRSI